MTEQLIGQSTLSGVLAYIPPPPTDGFELGPLSIHIYGIAIALGVVAAFWLANHRWRAIGRDPSELEPVALAAVAAGFIGGRIGYVIPRIGTFDPWWKVVAIWEGGLALYGGLTLGIITGLLLARRRGLPVLQTLDVVIPAIPLAQAIGRWGNYFNQELFGTPTTLPWALEVEPQFRPERYADFATFHPTFLYESLYNVVVVLVLLRLSRAGRLRAGSLALCYGMLYGAGRFLLELIRTDTTFRFLGLSRNAWVSLGVITLCLALLWWREIRRGGPADPAPRRPVPAAASASAAGQAGAGARGGEDNAAAEADVDVDADAERDGGEDTPRRAGEAAAPRRDPHAGSP